MPKINPEQSREFKEGFTKPLVVELGCGQYTGTGYVPILSRYALYKSGNGSVNGLNEREAEFYGRLFGEDLLNAQANYLGLDVTDVSFAEAEARKLGLLRDGVEFKQADVFKHIPLPNESADIVMGRGLARSVIGKVKDMAEIDRIIKFGGKLMVDDFFAIRDRKNLGLPKNYSLLETINFRNAEAFQNKTYLFQKQK